MGNLNAQLNLELLTDGKMNLGSGNGTGLLSIGTNSSTSFPTLRLTEEGDDFARITFENDHTSDKYWTLAGRPRATDKDSRFYFYYRNSASGGSNLMSLTGEGRLGINKSNPTAYLDVNGAIKMSMNVAPETEGMIRYNATNKNFEGYNGSDWKSLTEPVVQPPSYAIGDYEDEGVVFWISPDSRIVKFVYIGSLGIHTWSNPTNIDVNGAESNFDGEINTNEIALDPNLISSAAKLCRDLVTGGHTGWYMPAVSELSQLVDNQTTVNSTIQAYLGDILWEGIPATPIWSSTEETSGSAKNVNDNTAIINSSKTNSHEVRAIRTVVFD